MPKSRVKLRKPSIRHKDLSDDNVYGYAYKEDFEIEIDPKQSQREYLNTLLHEFFHCMLPDLSEHCVTRMADIIADEIWKRRYRKKK